LHDPGFFVLQSDGRVGHDSTAGVGNSSFDGTGELRPQWATDNEDQEQHTRKHDPTWDQGTLRDVNAFKKPKKFFARQRADNMNLLFAVKGDFLKRAFEKPKRYRSFSAH
jgi:hypothetical protein